MKLKLLLFSLLLTLALALTAAAPRQNAAATETPAALPTATLTPTPAPVPPVLQETWGWLTTASKFYGLPNIILILLGSGLVLFLLAIGRGVLKKGESWGEGLLDRLFFPITFQLAVRRYLRNFIAENRYFGFRGIELLALRPVELDRAYVSLELALDTNPTETGEKRRTKDLTLGLEDRTGLMSKKSQLVSLAQAIQKTSYLSLVGDAGSGKSALLQWAGLALARYRLGQNISKDQRQFVRAVGGWWPGNSLVPILLPLRDYCHLCHDKGQPPTPETLRQFIAEHADRCYPSLKLPAGFFIRTLENSCLLMLDGMDEVIPDERDAVRQAVESLLHASTNHRRNRYLITARPSAAHITQQLPDFRHVTLQPLTDEKRRALIELWCTAVYSYTDEANRRANDLTQRIQDDRVRSLGDTPLMVNIFALVYYHRRGNLPRERAELYDWAVHALLIDPHNVGQAVVDLEQWGGMQWQQRYDTLSLIAFLLHDSGTTNIRANELVEREDFWRRFGADPTTAKSAALDFLMQVAQRGGLLRQDVDRYDFYIRRFREFLAGRYLALKLESQWRQVLRKHIANDQWEQPIQLAAGLLACTNLEKAEKFLRQLRELKGDTVQRAHATALAGITIADLLQTEDQQVQNVLTRLRSQLPEEMLIAFEKTVPQLPLALRYSLGLALGELGDPRFFSAPCNRAGGAGAEQTRSGEVGVNLILPALVSIPAGPFRMGTDADDEERLKAQDVTVWEDEKPAHNVRIAYDYAIGQYPVTNVEFGCFYAARSYESPDFWSETGWRWRMGDWDTQDFSMYSKEIQDIYRNWLANRPKEKRSQPFWWDDSQWNAANLPVVGVSWFEAEAYCNWLTQMLRSTGKLAEGMLYRLPTEAEWEKAARPSVPPFSPLLAATNPELHQGENGGIKGGDWPWGNEWDAAKCNSAESGFHRSSPVGLFPEGAAHPTGPQQPGVYDLAGNVWEWTHSLYQPYPFDPADGREDPIAIGQRVLRGGSWNNYRYLARCAYRGRDVPDNFDDDVGFRVVLAPMLF